ncbi:MAG: hypothetical protein FWF50_07155 [Defluviitaleaceae bacterium]|nr:hypothetical protein [Defluviitaleaceae bacterium]
MKQQEFNEIINKKIFEENLTKLLEKIAKYPDRYVGLFRPTKPYSKIIQNISQSYEIRFGDALEAIFEKYMEYIGFENLEKRIITNTGQIYNIDLLFKSENTKTVYMVEQKVRDDHDSTKKRGQYTNFSEKYEIIEKVFNGYTVTAIMWFVDDSLRKNKNFYEAKIKIEILQKDKDSMHLVYGEEFFNISNELEEKSFWDVFIGQLKSWKDGIPEHPNINFDDEENINEVINQISPNKITNSIWKNLFTDERILNDIFPVIFPTGLAFRKYLTIFEDNSKRGLEIKKFMKEYLQKV